MSTTHCTEITKYAVSDTARAAGVKLPEPAAIPGSSQTTRVCAGPEVQEPQYYYHVRSWDATEDEHNPLLDAAGDAPAAPEGCTLEYRIHVHLQCEPRTALDAPLTEVVLWYLKPHATQAKVEELLTTLMGIVNKIPREEGMHRAGWGSVLGDPRQYVVMIGWDSMEAFHTAVANSPTGRAVLDQLAEHTDRHLRHIALEQQAQSALESRL